MFGASYKMLEVARGWAWLREGELSGV